MENKSKCCNSSSCKCCNSSSCWTKCISIFALLISLFCLGILVGQCMSNCSSKESKCKTKSYKNCKKVDTSSGSTCTYEKKEKECAESCQKKCCAKKDNK